MTTGAHVVIERLMAGGVEVCFANPGTSEMHFVAALDSAPQMRAVLCPFEGVATGAADGYARIAGRPAATLLHLGPGMANGLANLHNARRAHSPVVNIVGDHATYHQKLDAPLQSDIEALGGWLERNGAPTRVGRGSAAMRSTRRSSARRLLRQCRHTHPARGSVVERVDDSGPAHRTATVRRSTGG